MTVNQISIFLENKPESLSQLTEVLAKNNINNHYTKGRLPP